MNDKIDLTGETDQPDLPELSDATVARIESAVFAEIARDRAGTTERADLRRTRRRRWFTAAGIAAAFVAGVLVTPPLLGTLGGSVTATSGGSVVDSSTAESSGVAPLTDSAESTDTARGGQSAAYSPESGRDIIATANATIEVADVSKAADEIAALAEAHGGYVESTEIGKSSPADAATSTSPAPADPGYGWISIRVPSADLTAVIDDLSDSGEVLSSSISKQDVTSTAVDLRARVEATRASVQRLTELMSQSGSVSELIEAEVALTDRQAQLESYEQQLTMLEDQVAMSTLQVQLTRPTPQASADPAGFGDGLLAGWNGLIVSLNALVVALGFVLPWLAIAAVVFIAVWIIRRVRRRRRAAAEQTPDSE
ncbi:DUF4349 domain-containing protein [Microbacterium sp. XT11]|uniref:DUF4349 domain-containing protein n=1 Tax=Microbacterium sp. XT11 TaxID=367477 RepID=UPI000742F0ED|nr:DUF4349 domain-containing protein [Microbacterium sp. XT11]ALX66866.1 hypothetical protein AB663_002345 [Microbacterium sp. XT11]